MGGIVIQVEYVQENIEWNGRSFDVANFMNLDEIEITGIGEGDRHNGHIFFDPVKRQITINTEYFSMSAAALKFWRSIGFDVCFEKISRPDIDIENPKEDEII